MSPQPFVGKNAIVTGASRRIGACVAKSLACLGADVALVYPSSSAEAEVSNVIEDILQTAQGNPRCFALRVDMSKEDCGKILIEQASRHFGTIHIIENNAGVIANDYLSQVKVVDFEWQYNINVRGPMLLVQAALPYLQQGGRIINISSVSARGGYEQQTIYGGTKAAVEHMTRVWARELSPKYGVNVNAVSPGPVLTDMWKYGAGEESKESFKGTIDDTPAGARIAVPQDIADIVTLLCEERARWMTGDIVCANGGILMT